MSLHIKFGANLTPISLQEQKAKIKQLKTQLKSINNEGSSIVDYVLKIKKVVDSLDAIGAHVSIEENVEVILDGLPEDYCHLITTVLSRTVPYLVDKLEALLMAHEERLEKYKKKNDVALVQANLAHTTLNDGKKPQLESGGRLKVLEKEEVVEGLLEEEDQVGTLEVGHNVSFVGSLVILCGNVTTDLINPFPIQMTTISNPLLLHHLSITLVHSKLNLEHT